MTPKTGEVTIQIAGNNYTAWYSVEGGLITVISAYHGSKSTQLGHSREEDLAKVLLGELIRENSPPR